MRGRRRAGEKRTSGSSRWRKLPVHGAAAMAPLLPPFRRDRGMIGLAQMPSAGPCPLRGLPSAGTALCGDLALCGASPSAGTGTLGTSRGPCTAGGLTFFGNFDSGNFKCDAVRRKRACRDISGMGPCRLRRDSCCDGLQDVVLLCCQKRRAGQRSGFKS